MVNLPGQSGMATGMVNDDGVGAEGRDKCIENDRFDVRWVADHGEKYVAGGGEIGRGVGEIYAEGEEESGFRWGAGIDGEGVAGGDEARGHGAAHYADAYPSYPGPGRGY